MKRRHRMLLQKKNCSSDIINYGKAEVIPFIAKPSEVSIVDIAMYTPVGGRGSHLRCFFNFKVTFFCFFFFFPNKFPNKLKECQLFVEIPYSKLYKDIPAYLQHLHQGTFVMHQSGPQYVNKVYVCIANDNIQRRFPFL